MRLVVANPTPPALFEYFKASLTLSILMNAEVQASHEDVFQICLSMYLIRAHDVHFEILCHDNDSRRHSLLIFPHLDTNRYRATIKVRNFNIRNAIFEGWTIKREEVKILCCQPVGIRSVT